MNHPKMLADEKLKRLAVIRVSLEFLAVMMVEGWSTKRAAYPPSDSAVEVIRCTHGVPPGARFVRAAWDLYSSDSPREIHLLFEHESFPEHDPAAGTWPLEIVPVFEVSA